MYFHFLRENTSFHLTLNNRLNLHITWISMSNQADEKAFELLEKAISKAQHSLENTKCFQPFILLLTQDNEVELYENEIKDYEKSYAALEQELHRRIQKRNDVDVVILAVDTIIPEQFAKEVSHGIRIHLEEKSQIEKKIGARFLYIPYEMCQNSEKNLFIKLHAPIAVGFPAEYIKGALN